MEDFTWCIRNSGIRVSCKILVNLQSRRDTHPKLGFEVQTDVAMSMLKGYQSFIAFMTVFSGQRRAGHSSKCKMAWEHQERRLAQGFIVVRYGARLEFLWMIWICDLHQRGKHPGFPHKQKGDGGKS